MNLFLHAQCKTGWILVYLGTIGGIGMRIVMNFDSRCDSIFYLVLIPSSDLIADQARIIRI